MVNQNRVQAEVRAGQRKSCSSDRRLQQLWSESPEKRFWAPEEGLGLARAVVQPRTPHAVLFLAIISTVFSISPLVLSFTG